INEDALAMSSYLHDFMVLIHNELLSSYFKHSRSVRMTLDPNYKVLTKDGIIERLDHKMISQMEEWKTRLLTVAPANVKHALSKNVCPECSSSLLVLRVEDGNTATTFNFACGHKIDIDEKTNI
ncbi:MAG TPA: hypothetical protein VEC13_00145, partial [Candidatus Paceibacterota bacterium]|nr:hypothetical protein [Candidatus Paceibacterota bacterium]